MRLARLPLTIFNLLIATSTIFGAVTFNSRPTSPTQLFSGGASTQYFINDLSGGHHFQYVGAETTTILNSNVATSTFTFPEVPDTNPYPYIGPNGPEYIGGLYPATVAGTSQASLTVGPSTFIAAAQWDIYGGTPYSGISLNLALTVTNVPATLSIEQDFDGFLVVLNTDSGQYYAAGMSPGNYLNLPDISLPPGHYTVRYENFYPNSTPSGHYSLSIVPEVSSVWLMAGGMSVLGILFHLRRRRTN